MNKDEFLYAGNENQKYIERCIAALNNIVKLEKPAETFGDRLKLLIAASKKVSDCQDLYMTCYNTSGNLEGIIEFDYQTSTYANRLYVAIQNTLKYYFKKSHMFDKDLTMEPLIMDLHSLSDRMMYIAARWYSERQMDVWDSDKPYSKKKLPQRLPLLHDVMPCFDRILAVKMGIRFDDGFNPKRLVICMPPSGGKTYEANIYTNQMLAHHYIRFRETGIIRMTNNAENAYNYGSQVYKMMTDDKFANIFPEFAGFKSSSGKNRMFLYESREKYLLRDCNPECSDSMFLFGRDAGINGKRSLLGAVIDDLSDGQTTMDNDDMHKKMTDKIMSDVLDRSDDDDCPIIIMGTMYNENDIQNKFIEMWERLGLVQHPQYPNVRYTEDGQYAICLVDIEDANGNSIAPLLYSNKKLKEKKDYFASVGKSYVYNLIYRQQRDSREPKAFADESLMHYKWGQLPDTLSDTSVSIMDLTRKSGNDYFSNPYFKYDDVEKLYYLTDAVFEQKSLGIVNDPKNEFRDKICYKIITNCTVECCIENNTSNTTGTLLRDRCKELGYDCCSFRERYTARSQAINKVQRILNMEETIKAHIVFPDKSTIPVGHPLYQAMDQLNNWNSKDTSKKNHDDFPDALAMFAEEFIFKKQRIVSITGVKKSSFF